MIITQLSFIALALIAPAAEAAGLRHGFFTSAAQNEDPPEVVKNGEIPPGLDKNGKFEKLEERLNQLPGQAPSKAVATLHAVNAQVFVDDEFPIKDSDVEQYATDPDATKHSFRRRTSSIANEVRSERRPQTEDCTVTVIADTSLFQPEAHLELEEFLCEIDPADNDGQGKHTLPIKASEAQMESFKKLLADGDLVSYSSFSPRMTFCYSRMTFCFTLVQSILTFHFLFF